MYAKLPLAVATLAALTTAAPISMSASTKRTNTDSYTYYTGNGSNAAGWPAMTSWGTWDQLWNTNLPLIQQSCGWNNWGANDSSDEIANIKAAITAQASASGIDQRFILAIMMQESKGCVRVPTTGNGVTNPGLMQSHDGAGTCAGVNPCPKAEITQMIKDGVSGTSSGDGLKQTVAQGTSDVGSETARAYYIGARIYNSGSVDLSNLDDGLGSTACYASDVANRLTGWALAASSCTA
ncbi:putative muramidase [Xylariaceae sp. FL0255]|nr:putative muramidase [Xylariaceae sp. FL0255]